MVNVIGTAWLGVEEAGRAVFNWLDFDPATLNGKNDFVDECGNLEGKTCTSLAGSDRKVRDNQPRRSSRLT
jgi:hypothetical protein